MSQDPKHTPPVENPFPGPAEQEVAQEDWRGRGQTLTIIAWVVGSVVSLGVLLYLTLTLSSTQPTEPNKRQVNSGDSPLLAARAALLKQGDLATCRMALQQLNNHLYRAPEHQAPEPGS